MGRSSADDRRSPFTLNVRDGTIWYTIALKLAEFHRCLPEDLWPDAILAIKQPEVKRLLDVSELRALAETAEREKRWTDVR